MAAPKVYSVGSTPISAPTGSERVWVDNGSGGNAYLTAAQIAALASNFGNDSPTNVTATVGATITAAQLLTGLINRSGPTAVYTDTTDTAGALALAINPPTYPTSFYIDFKNTTAFQQTLTGGTGVTFSSSPIIPANSVSEFLVVLSSATATVFNHIFTAPLTGMGLEVATALTTVGAGTITGAGIAAQVTTRGGTQTAAFTDTTDIAANIIAAQPNAHIGAAWEYTYVNNTIWPATIQGGTGVTITGFTITAPNAWTRYLVTYTAAATITMVAIGQGHFGTIGTVTANAATPVPVTQAAVTATSQILLTYKSGTQGATGAFVSSVTPGTGFSIKSVASDTAVYNYLILG